MSRANSFLPDDLYDYMTSVSVREPAILRRLREETASHPMGGMQIPAEHGYSSLAVALALPNEGTILACDVSEEYTSVARRYWKEAGVDHMIDLRIRPALETLQELLAQSSGIPFDFAFIDADKANYEGYYEYALKLIRPGGLIAIDNVLWHGKVIDPEANDADTLAIRALNKKLLGDSRINLSLLPISDGLTLCYKR
jgi:predicted O-methyltransferase YrrM